jgi:excisionase family DNA binding protein
MERMVLSVPEAGRALGLGRCAAYEAARSGVLPVIQVGRRKLVPLAALEQLLGLAPGSISVADFAVSRPKKRSVTDAAI